MADLHTYDTCTNNTESLPLLMNESFLLFWRLQRATIHQLQLTGLSKQFGVSKCVKSGSAKCPLCTYLRMCASLHVYMYTRLHVCRYARMDVCTTYARHTIVYNLKIIRHFMNSVCFLLTRQFFATFPSILIELYSRAQKKLYTFKMRIARLKVFSILDFYISF